MKILCVNAGSSSLKFQLVEMPEEKVLINGYIEKIGQPDCFWNVKVNGEKIRSERPLKNHNCSFWSLNFSCIRIRECRLNKILRVLG